MIKRRLLLIASMVAAIVILGPCLIPLPAQPDLTADEVAAQLHLTAILTSSPPK